MELSDSDIKIIRKVATWYAKKFDNETNELQNVATLAVLEDEGLGCIKDHESFINTLATNAIMRFVSEDVLVRIPNRSRSVWDIKDRLLESTNPETSIISPTMDPREHVELMESLRYSAKSPMEMAYLELRIAGSTNQEAIIELDISESKASRMLRAIEQRFRK